MNAPLTSHPVPPYRHTPLFPLGKDDTPYRKIEVRPANRRARRENHGPRHAGGRARGDARARGGGVHRHQSSAAARPPRAAQEDPRATRRRPTTTSSSPTTSSRTPTSRPAACCRCARTPAPPSSWARRAGSSSPTATTRRRSPRARATPISSATCAIRSSRRSRCSRRRTPQSNMPAQVEIYAGGRGRLQVPVHRQGRRLGQQVVPVPGDAVDPHPRPHDRVPEGEDPDARHRGVPALSPGDRDRRHLGRADDEDREARLDALSRRACRPRAARTATPSAISRWSRRCTSSRSRSASARSSAASISATTCA